MTVHINTINLWNRNWKQIFDADLEMAETTRQAVLAKIAGDRALVFAYAGIGYWRSRDRGGFDWQPVNWQFES